LPAEVLASISGYYRRVTTEAYPMNRLVALVMLLTLVAICMEIVQGEYAWWIGWGSLLLAGSGFVPTMTRTAERSAIGKRAGHRGRAVETSARDLPRPHVQLRANELRSHPATVCTIDVSLPRFVPLLTLPAIFCDLIG
jgi:hypothetical protein